MYIVRENVPFPSLPRAVTPKLVVKEMSSTMIGSWECIRSWSRQRVSRRWSECWRSSPVPRCKTADPGPDTGTPIKDKIEEKGQHGTLWQLYRSVNPVWLEWKLLTMVKIINTTVLLDKRKFMGPCRVPKTIEPDREKSAINYLINAVIEWT